MSNDAVSNDDKCIVELFETTMENTDALTDIQDCVRVANPKIKHFLLVTTDIASFLVFDSKKVTLPPKTLRNVESSRIL